MAGKPGPKKKPTSVLEFTGNPGKRPLPKNEPKPEPVRVGRIPKPPAFFNRYAVFEWRRRYRQLATMGILSEADLTVLKQYCQAFGRWYRAELELKHKGEIVLSPNGYPQQSPWLAIANKAFEQMRKIGPELGFSPSSRRDLEVPTPPAVGGGRRKPPLS